MSLTLPSWLWAHDHGPPSWYAVQTSEWMEQRVARWLRAMRLFGVYAPTVLERTPDDRPRWRRVPLIREYVFLRMGNWAENVVRVLRLANVVAVIGPIPEDEMYALKWVEFELNRPGTPRRRPRKGWRRRRE